MRGEMVQIAGLEASPQHNGRIGQISAGCAVTVVGLQKAEQHNGRQGEVVAYVPEKDRFRVKLQHQGGGDAGRRRRQKPEWLNVRAANLDPGRYTVRVEGVQKPLRVRPANLLVVGQIPSRRPGGEEGQDREGQQQQRQLSLVEGTGEPAVPILESVHFD
jgi:hypothetical protein